MKGGGRKRRVGTTGSLGPQHLVLPHRGRESTVRDRSSGGRACPSPDPLRAPVRPWSRHIPRVHVRCAQTVSRTFALVAQPQGGNSGSSRTQGQKTASFPLTSNNPKYSEP